jgi:SprT protein
MNDVEMKAQVVKKVNDLLVVFENKADMRLNYVPEIKFTKKGTTAGTCSFNMVTGSCVLNFNMDILRNNFDTFIEDIVVHEVAHYLTDRLHGVVMRGKRVSHHGKEWKYMMRFLGAKEIKRCHSYRVDKISHKKVKRFRYSCGCNAKHIVSTVTHNRIQRGQQVYGCKYCREEIKFVERIK